MVQWHTAHRINTAIHFFLVFFAAFFSFNQQPTSSRHWQMTNESQRNWSSATSDPLAHEPHVKTIQLQLKEVNPCFFFFFSPSLSFCRYSRRHSPSPYPSIVHPSCPTYGEEMPPTLIQSVSSLTAWESLKLQPGRVSHSSHSTSRCLRRVSQTAAFDWWVFDWPPAVSPQLGRIW